MKRKVLILIAFIIPMQLTLQAQKILTLKECYNMAASTSALAGEKSSYSEISDLRDQNLSKSWLPTLDANGSFVYNSSVIDMSSVLGSLPVPGIANLINPLPHEQYKVTVDINQIIYDGGAIKGARALERADYNINEKQNEADIYKLRGQVNAYYFNLLLLGRQREVFNSYLELIKKRISAAQSAVVNGVVLKSDIDVLTSEKIKLEQQITQNDITRSSLLKILSGMIGTDLDPATEFTLPQSVKSLSKELLRPELQLFDLRKEQLGAGMKIIESKRLPKAFGFATLGYGNPPGSNFFKDEFAPYYIVGAGIKWNIFDWHKSKNEKSVITLQQGIIEKKKTDLADNLTRLLESKNAEIRGLQALINTDNELITLRKRISSSAESKYDNGTITATDLLNEINAERQAVLNFEIHKINLAMAEVEYFNISGQEIE